MKKLAALPAVVALAILFGGALANAENAYITGSVGVSVIDTATDKVTKTIGGLPHAFGVAVSPDGRKVYVGTDLTVWVIDAINNGRTAINSFPIGLALSHDGKKLYVAEGTDDRVQVIDTKDNTTITTIPVASKAFGVAVSGNDKVYATISGSPIIGGVSNVTVIDAGTKKVTNTINVGLLPKGVAIRPGDREVWVAVNNIDSVVRIDARNDTVLSNVTVKSPFGLAFSPDGKKVYVTGVASGQGFLAVINADTAKVAATVTVGDAPEGVAVTSDGNKVYVANNFSDDVSVIDAKTDQVIKTIPVSGNPAAFGIFIKPRE